jgi:hypothetical protein
MEQEEERIRTENERLEQLRAAKARIDRERAEAAREEEERRRTDRDAKIAAAALRARIEALAKPPPPPVVVAAPPPIAPPAKPSRFVPGVATGAIFGVIAAAACWYAVGAPRIARATKQAVDAWAELDHVRTRAHDAQRTSDDALEQMRKDTEALRAENTRLRGELAAPKPCTTATVAPHRTQRAHCDPHDPLCGDL